MSRAYDDFERISCTSEIKDEKDGYYSFLDTCFYGEKGGMLADTGTINGLKVLDLKWEGDTLYHKVDGILENPVNMEVCWEDRKINTSVQTAFHLMDGYFEARGMYLPAVGVSKDNQWFEVNNKDLTEEDLNDVQIFMNRVIEEDIPVEFSYVKGSDYPDEKYQKYDEVRLVKIGDYNTQPCGTLHLNRTGQIESFQILGMKKSSRGTRVFTTVGPVTNLRFAEEHKIVSDLAALLETNTGDLYDMVLNLKNKNKEMKKELKELKKNL